MGMVEFVSGTLVTSPSPMALDRSHVFINVLGTHNDAWTFLFETGSHVTQAGLEPLMFLSARMKMKYNVNASL